MIILGRGNGGMGKHTGLLIGGPKQSRRPEWLDTERRI